MKGQRENAAKEKEEGWRGGRRAKMTWTTMGKKHGRRHENLFLFEGD